LLLVIISLHTAEVLEPQRQRLAIDIRSLLS
jgi:hypothetical protein